MKKLLAISDRRLMGHDLVERAALLMEKLGDRVIVQLREKDVSSRTLYSWTEALAREAARTGATLYVNGRADVARCFEGVGLHLPEDGLPLGEARIFLSTGAKI